MLVSRFPCIGCQVCNLLIKEMEKYQIINYLICSLTYFLQLLRTYTSRFRNRCEGTN